MAEMTIAERDRAQRTEQLIDEVHLSRQGQRPVKNGKAQLLLSASQRGGRSVFELVREFDRLSRGRGQLRLDEYLRYALFDPQLHDQNSRSRFVSTRLHDPIMHACCDMSWEATTEDKWLCARIVDGSGIDMLQTLAVVDVGSRNYPGCAVIKTAADLAKFLAEGDKLPLFGKENRGNGSYGVFLATEADRSRIHLKGEGWLEFEEFLTKFVGERSYLLQSVEQNHPFFEPFCTSLATLRLYLFVNGDDIAIPFAVLKLPCGQNLADNFWREGNLACAVDPQTGIVQTVRRAENGAICTYEDHPDNIAPLVGEAIPMWGELLTMARSCAKLFQPIGYQSMDIAVTAHGPKLVEINTGGAFDLPQIATGRGFLTDEVVKHLHDRGFDKI